MGLKAMIVLFICLAFSFLVLTPSSAILPYWITSNQQLYSFTIIIWLISFIIAFAKFGLEI
jgi:hypothetical protein